jgi:hypothetical protein
MALSLMFFLMEKHNSHRNHYIADFEPNASAILLHLTVYCANRQSSKVRRHSSAYRRSAPLTHVREKKMAAQAPRLKLPLTHR